MAYVVVFQNHPEIETVIVEHAQDAHEIVATFAKCGVRAVVTDEAGKEIAPCDPADSRAAGEPSAGDDPDAPPSLWWT